MATINVVTGVAVDSVRRLLAFAVLASTFLELGSSHSDLLSFSRDRISGGRYHTRLHFQQPYELQERLKAVQGGSSKG